MPVTILPSSQTLRGVNLDHESAATNARKLLKSSCIKTLEKRCGEIFQSSFADGSSSSTNAAHRTLSKEAPASNSAANRFAATNLSDTPVLPAHNGNGFVDACMRAYNHHHALILRPDDVWLAILTQFNLFVNSRAEELRHLFVEHEGQKELTVYAVGTRYTVDFGAMSKEMGRVLEENVVDKGLRDWIIPDFSTSTENDRVVSSVIMMATLQKYFLYSFCLLCGIPSVRLLGEKADWEKLLSKIDKLKEYGPETTQWHSLLVPVLSRFITSFDSPDSDSTKQFWQRIAHRRGGGSMEPQLSGWITAFCFFSAKGVPLYTEREMEPLRRKINHLKENPDPSVSATRQDPWNAAKVLELDGIVYHTIGTTKIPPAFAEVPVRLIDNGLEFKTVMVAGVVGIRVTSSGISEPGAKGMTHDGKNDTLQPEAGWWLFEDIEKTEAAAKNGVEHGL